jgi:aminoglycoside phosphotransferase family enzyme/predicted kinase
VAPRPDPADEPSPRKESDADGVVETHLSVLVLLGERVYKFRKPVRFEFVDFTEREARRQDCLREVELNRRLAPDVYLGVADLVLEGGSLEHCVVMRRLPQERRLSALLRGAFDVGPCLDAVARTLAAFHARATRGPAIDAAGTVEAVRAGWEANFAEARPFVGSLLARRTDARVRELALRYLSGRAALFAQRIAEGFVCDGHGDLLADDVFCLEDGPRLLDCLEFDDRLRYGDVLADVAFLAMDLERLGAPEAATRLLDAYAAHSGRSQPSSLSHHYRAARAYVRAKVACLRAVQATDETTRRRAASEARTCHELALAHLQAGRVVLVLVGGHPGSGKSTLASALAARRGLELWRSDEVRKSLAGLPTNRPSPAGYREGLYDDRTTEATYEALLDRATTALGLGRSVVLDATWARAAHRDAARAAAARSGADLVELRLALDPAAAARRVAARPPGGPSDATAELVAALARDADPWPTAVALDATRPADLVLEAALEALDRVASR